MKTDIENLRKIYESFKRSNLDFLHLENVNNFDWNNFHEEYSLHQFYLFEKFEHLTDVKTSNGIESIYRLTSDLGSVYNLKLNWVKQIQRYGLANHLYWLSNNKPGCTFS